MTNIRFTLVRFLSVPVAILFVIDWMLLPSKLQVSQATEQVVSAKYGTIKGDRVAYLLRQSGEETRVSCSMAGPLCTALRSGRSRNLTVWLQEPGRLHGVWVVAAKDNGRDVVTSEDVKPAYREFKIVSAVIALVLVVVAFVSWYFAPFSNEDPKD